MAEQRLREIAERLREFGEFAQADSIDVSVSVDDYEYFVDLGAFGEQSMYITIDDHEERVDADGLLDNFPIDSSTFFNLAEELEAFEGTSDKEATLDEVLIRMEENGEGSLARALRAVTEEFRSIVLKASDMSGLSIGPLPPLPLPWPGALRPEIDYTAADFPLRYQPPPGFDWADEGERRVPYDRAVAVAAVDVASGGSLLMDSLGRARWYNNNDSKDTYTEGKRWKIWYMTRDGIPSSNGFNGSDAPRAIDANGVVIEEPGAVYLTRFFDDPEAVERRVREIRAAYEASPPTQNGAPQDNENTLYDPLTVSLEEETSLVKSRELRLGDDIIGNSFGRVTAIEDDQVVMNRDGVINRTSYKETFVWEVRKINLPNRDSLPAVASLQAAVF